MKGSRRSRTDSFSGEGASGSPANLADEEKAGGGGSQSVPTRVLVHMCCGPCSIFPIKSILKESAQVFGFFHNPNIHPRSEFRLRLEAVKKLAALLDLDVIYDEEYRPTAFIKGMKDSLLPEDKGGKPPEGPRCSYCYSERLEATARWASENGFDAFSSSLLYSRYANHDEIKELGLALADRYGLKFYYEDFRPGWVSGIEESKEMGLYRQKYCGCIYSKIERFSKKKKKKGPAP